MKALYKLVAVPALIFTSQVAADTCEVEDTSAEYQLVFEDNFDGLTLDPNKWKTSFLWGPYLAINNEEQYYVDALGSDSTSSADSPFVIDNGILSITARKASDIDGYKKLKIT